jgi:hypothetical protein
MAEPLPCLGFLSHLAPTPLMRCRSQPRLAQPGAARLVRRSHVAGAWERPVAELGRGVQAT